MDAALIIYPIIQPGSIGSDQTICTGTSPSILTGTLPSGGNGNYTYQWESGNNNIWSSLPGATQIDYNSGIHTQTTLYRRLVYSGNCPGDTTNVIQISVEVPASPNTIGNDQTIFAGTTPVNLTGSLPTGGNSNYIYQWESTSDQVLWSGVNGGSTQNLSLPNATQSVWYRRILNSGACPADTSLVAALIIYPVILPGSIGADQTICTGTSPTLLSGTLPSGGNGNYTYQWESGNNNTWSSLPGATQIDYNSGIHTQTTLYRRLVYSGNCPGDTTNIIQISVEVPASPNTIGNDQTICAGTSPVNLTGSLPTGGNSNYIYQWESSHDQSNWSNIVSGTNSNYIPSALSQTSYYRRILGSGVCNAHTSNPVQIRVEYLAYPNIINTDQTICAGTQAAVISGSQPSGGNGSYVYFWEESNDQVQWYPVFSGNQINLNPGVLMNETWYRRLIQSGVCGGTISNSVKISLEQILGNNIIQSDQTICQGDVFQLLSGSVPSGGNMQYAYQWESALIPGNWQTVTGANQQDHLPDNSPVSVRWRRIVSSGVCSQNISNPIHLLVSPPLTNNMLWVPGQVCAGSQPGYITGSIPQGAGGAYQYQWESSTNMLNWQIIPGESQTGYLPGPMNTVHYYRRTVLSAHCPQNVSMPVSIMLLPPLNNNTIGNNQTLCRGIVPQQISGSLPQGGSGSYLYSWVQSTDALSWSPVSQANTMHYQPGPLMVSTYLRRLIQDGFCPADTSAPILLLQAQDITLNHIGNPEIICAGTHPEILTGSLPSGGNPPMQYQWIQNAGTGWQVLPGATDQDYQPDRLWAQTYFSRVVYSMNCYPDSSVPVWIGVSNPVTNNMIASDQTICESSEFATLIGTVPLGGNGNFVYQWESSTNFTQWFAISGSSVQNLNGLSLQQSAWFRRIVLPGVCPQDTTPFVHIRVESKPVITGITDTICPGDTALLKAFSNQQGIFTWLPLNVSGDEVSVYTQQPMSVQLYQHAGYCTSDTVSLVIEVNTPPEISLSTGNYVQSCYGTALTTEVLGADYCQWAGITPSACTQVFTQPGAYQVIGTDTNGCTDTLDLHFDWYAEMNVHMQVQDPACYQDSNGIVNIQVMGINPVQVLWQDGFIGNTRTDLSEGSYSIMLTDGMACQKNIQAILNEPSQLNIQAQINNLNCSGINNGSIISQGTGGVAPYQYNWNTGSTLPQLTGLDAGVYFLILSDANACMDTMSFYLTMPESLDVHFTDFQHPDCKGNRGRATIEVQGGQPPYQYLWNTSPVQNQSTAVNFTPGTYTLQVKDAAGCLNETVFVMEDPGSFTVMTLIPDTVCPGTPIFLSAAPQGGQAPYDYLWYSPEGLSNTNSQIVELIAYTSGVKTVQITDANGCIAQANVAYTLKPAPVADFTFQGCQEPCTLDLKNPVVWINNSKGASAYEWLLPDGYTQNFFVPVYHFSEPGTYEVLLIVKSPLGCMDSIRKEIVAELFNPIIYYPTGFSPNGDGINDYFFIPNQDLISMNIKIFDRWGNMVYISDNLDFKWNGSVNGVPVPEGVYTFVVNGMSKAEVPVHISGTVTLIR